ncbi:hypothetical protein [Borrelia sp. RT5S]|uniref:hypothetical protein n=1 Tax=Borrelia sp. RT5S TaxID=2898581 RepID=UPI001E38B29A|nr:hypothetical protein [Borrelia sp. RT5S]UGQ16760.1 hypothetical protein LSO06_05415 [Borrelia sp. RT5S]
MRYNLPSIEVGRSMGYCYSRCVFGFLGLRRAVVLFAVLMILSCDNYNFDVGLRKDLLDLGDKKASSELAEDRPRSGREVTSDAGAAVKKPGVAGVGGDKDVLDLDEKADIKKEVPSVIEAIPVKGDSLLPGAPVKVDSPVAEAGSLDSVIDADGVVLLGEEVLVEDDSDSLGAGKEEKQDEIKVDWLNRMGASHKETLEYLKGVLQDERYKARLGGSHAAIYEEDVQRYAYSEELVLGFLASIGERGTQDMLTQIKHAREAVDKYSGEGDREDILYDLESDLSYAFYQTKIYDRKPNNEVLDKIKACSESFIKNINNELVLMNKGGLLDSDESTWSEKLKEHLSEDEMHTLRICELLLRDKDISLQSVGDRFILLSKDKLHKTVKKLKQLISSALVKGIGGATSEKITKEKIAQQLESLSEDDKMKLDALCDRLHHVFQHLTSSKLSLKKMYETLQELMNQAIKELKDNDFRIKYAQSAP